MTKFNVTSPSLETNASTKIITLAAGCFWGVERVFSKHFKSRGLVDIKVGYANGSAAIPDVTYKQVCSGATGYAECVQISYNEQYLLLKEILDIFFRIHDPTTVNSQGPDVGTQYRSGIFTHSKQDLETANDCKKYFQAEWYPNSRVTTTIEPIKNWYDAEDYHQRYLLKNPGGYECPTHFLRTRPKV